MEREFEDRLTFWYFFVGKTEEVVLKKLEYIYAKQKAVEAQKKKQPVQEEPVVTSTASTQQEGSSAPIKELTQIPMTNRRGKPLILARKAVRATGGLKAMHVSQKGETNIQAAPHRRENVSLLVQETSFLKHN